MNSEIAQGYKPEFLSLALKEMIGKAVIIIVALCSTCANGICPAQENDTTVVLPYKTVIGSSGLDARKIKTTTRIANKPFWLGAKTLH